MVLFNRFTSDIFLHSAQTQKKKLNLSLVFFGHSQVNLKFFFLIVRNKKRQEVDVLKRATCNEQVEFEHLV